jgi:hypothetical protein
MGRAMDDAIIAAATGTAYSGVAGGTSVSLPSGQKVAHASGGLTVAKLLSAKEILDASKKTSQSNLPLGLVANSLLASISAKVPSKSNIIVFFFITEYNT